VSRPRVKICGVTRPEDALLAAELGAELVGVNFWPRSPRRVDPERARAIVQAVAGSARVAGVFVDEPPGRVDELADSVGLDLVQLHGDEPAAELARLVARFACLRALRCDAARLAAPEPFAGAPPGVAFWLLDAPAGERYGGTGEPWEWGRARRLVERAPGPVLIAGGIRPGNARAALAATGAAGVDVASGVESAPGVKDPEKMRRLMEELAR
jgi:phosphoribosylanthranilate isomerase